MATKGETRTLTLDGHEITITHSDRVLWPDAGLTKMDLVEYYTIIAPYILPHISGRPLTLKPYSYGITGPHFYTHNAPKGTPDWVKTFEFVPKTKSSKTIHPIIADNAATLAWLANRSVIEIHTWLSRIDDINKPDVLVFDLDPGEQTSFPRVLEAALLLKGKLENMQLKGWPKTSGGTGVHIYVPIKRQYTYEQTRGFAERVANELAEEEPDKIASSLADSRLANKVLVDYAQNSLGRTMASVYSVRPRPGAPVSTPLTWSEVEKGNFTPEEFNLRTVPGRVKKQGDIFKPVADLSQELPVEAH